MSTSPPSTEQPGAVRVGAPNRRRRGLLFLLLGLLAVIVLIGLLYLLLHDDKSSVDPAADPAASTGSLPNSPAPSALNGGGAGQVAPGAAPSASSSSPTGLRAGAASDAGTGSGNGTGASSGGAGTVGWVGGAGEKPTSLTGGLAREGSVGTVLFPTGSAEVDADARQVVVAVAKQLQTQKPSSVRVTGYTDNVGTPAYNLRLSQRRARAVSAILRAQLPPGWVVSTGKGWADPVAANTTDANRQQNRRVTITTT